MSGYQPPQQGGPWQQQGQPQQMYPPGNYPAPASARPLAQQQYAPRKTALTGAEKFWYVLGCIPMGAAYFSKIPAKKALQDFGMARMTGAESFWYVLMCIGFGAGYFAKISTAKALTEMTPR